MTRERDRRHAPTAQSPLAAAVSDVAELLTGDSGTSKTFVGGLVAGALVGAAMAGAALVRSRTVRDAPSGRPTREG